MKNYLFITPFTIFLISLLISQNEIQIEMLTNKGNTYSESGTPNESFAGDSSL